MRKVIFRVIFPVLAIALAACGPSAPKTAPALNVAVLTLPYGLGNPYISNTTPNTAIWHALFDGLTRIDDTFQLAPSLATAWTRESARTWVFTLRQGVTFSNGRPFTAAAVVAAVDWLRTPAGQATLVGADFGPNLTATARDDFTVVLTTADPDPVLPSRASWLPIVEPQAWRTLGPDGFAQKPEGTGPYRLVTWNDNGRAHVVKNPGAWRKPAIDEIFFVPIPDPIARSQALVSGTADIAQVDRDGLDAAAAQDISIVSASGVQVLAMGFVTLGHDKSPFRVEKVRQAANYAVDKTRIVTEILHGYGRVAGQFAPAVSPGYNAAVTPYPYDPEKARQLMREAGYGEGFDIVLAVLNDSATTSIFQAVARDLAAVGIRSTIKLIPFSSWQKSFFSGDWGDAEAMGISATSHMNDPLHGMTIFAGLRAAPFHRDPALIATLERIEGLDDAAVRRAEIERAAVQFHDAAPGLFLIDFDMQIGFGPRVAKGKVANRVPVYEDVTWKAAP